MDGQEQRPEMGRKIAMLRENNNWRIHELARRAGVGVHVIRRLENGTTAFERLPVSAGMGIALAFGVTVVELMTHETVTLLQLITERQHEEEGREDNDDWSSLPRLAGV